VKRGIQVAAIEPVPKMIRRFMKGPGSNLEEAVELPPVL
jgi:hypothetical protein